MEPIQGTNIQITLSDDKDILDFLANIPPKDVALTLCTQEEARIRINEKDCVWRRNEILVSYPGILIENLQPDTNFGCFSIAFPTFFINRLPLLRWNNWDKINLLEQNPLVLLTEGETRIFCQYYHLFDMKIKGAHGKYYREQLCCLLEAFIYQFCDAVSRCTEKGSHAYPFSASEILLNKFIMRLSSLYPRERNVGFYADKLNVSAKYLTEVCKTLTGHTATQIINKYVTKDIDLLLRKTNLSIKEIMYELNFPNLSFFGKYVKKHLGMSPKHYREMMLEAVKT